VSGLRGRPAITLVARREITQRIREKSFLISMAVTVTLVVLVAVVPPLFGFGGKQSFTVAVTDNASLAVAETAQRSAKAFDTELKVRGRSAGDANAAVAAGKVDGVLSARGLHAEDEPDATLVGLIENARREVEQSQALKRAGLSEAQAQ
jgi:ABC-2 type transport system permease protein